MRFTNEADAVTYIFRSLRKVREVRRGYDEHTRDIAPTERLLSAARLLDVPREYAVVTGSKGKGSTTAITAKVLQHIGHRVGMITSPHLVSYRERIRIDGRAIPEADLCRILGALAPEIDHIEQALDHDRYFSPQGIFLAVGLQWFNEQGVDAAVLEVGRGGRFDDIAVVHNNLSLFTPIMLEHVQQLGPTLERIAWHKAGIIKPHSYAYSVPQAAEVLAVLEREAETEQAEFFWIASMDMGSLVAPTPTGIQMTLGRYGLLDVSLMGYYQVENVTLAVQGVGNMHGRLGGISHGAPEYVERIRAGLADVRWPGRLHQLQSHPAVYVDGAINGASARALAESLESRLSEPVIAVIGVPDDKDYAGVYTEIGLIADRVILTETTRNPSLNFLEPSVALAVASRFNPDTEYAPDVQAAVARALSLAGSDGTVLVVGTLSVVADTILLWGESYEQI